MRHSVHIMFGRISEEILPNLKQYVLKYGDSEVSAYFTAMHVGYEGDDYVIKEAIRDSIDPDRVSFEDSFNVHYEEKARISKANPEALKSFLVSLKRSIINADRPGDFPELHYCMYVPLFIPDIWEHAKLFADLLRKDVYPIPQVDIVGFCAEMADVFVSDVNYDESIKTTSRTLKEMCDFNHAAKAIQHIIAIDNKQSTGVALKLDQKTLVSILGEFALLVVEKYSALFDVIAAD